MYSDFCENTSNSFSEYREKYLKYEAEKKELSTVTQNKKSDPNCYEKSIKKLCDYFNI